MPRRPRKVAEERRRLELTPELTVPLRLITESGRTNTRASVTHTAVHIRIPAGLTTQDRQKSIREMLDWVRRTHKKKPAAFDHFVKTKATPGGKYTFDFRGETHSIVVVANTTKTHKISKVGPNELLVQLHAADRRAGTGELLEKLLAKYFGERSLPHVSQRVHALNDLHFRKPINAVKLSDTYSRWGSCSQRGNINLATRLCLAPDVILDAVIIHELAHLVHANHSPAFWAVVERALPEYREYDQWLREHGGELRFRAELVED